MTQSLDADFDLLSINNSMLSPFDMMKDQNDNFLSSPFSNSQFGEQSCIFNDESIDMYKFENKKTNDTQPKEKSSENSETSLSQLQSQLPKVKEIQISLSEELKSDKKLPPKQYTPAEIALIIQYSFSIQPNLLNVLKDILQTSPILEEMNTKMSDKAFLDIKRRKRGGVKEPKEDIRLGRKRRDDQTKGDHNSESQDNIMKKIKSHLFKKMLTFLNEVLNLFLEDYNKKKCIQMMRKIPDGKDIKIEQLLKGLNYKIIVDDLKREFNLKLLDKTLREIFSTDLSSKFSTIDSTSNKDVLDKIFENDLDEDVTQIFNLTLREFIDIITYKNSIYFNNPKYNELIDNVKIDKIIEGIYENKIDKKTELGKFTYLSFNYERWFFIKSIRNTGKKKE